MAQPAVQASSNFPGASAFRWPSTKRGDRGFKHLSDRLDAAENIAFLRELEFISKKLYEIKYGPLLGRTMVPTDNEGMGPGYKSHTYRQWDKKAMVKAIEDYSDDLPLVNVHGVEYTQRIQGYGNAYGYSQDEIAAAAILGRPLEADRAQVAKEGIDQKIDAICGAGDAQYGLRGLLTLQSTNTFTPATLGGGGTAWLTAGGVEIATPDEILACMNGAVRQVITSTLETERPTRIVLPTAQFQHISTRARSTVSDTTIKRFFELNNPGIEIVSWPKLTLGAWDPSSPSSTPTTDRMLVYDPKVEKVKLLMPLEFAQTAPERRNLSYLVSCWMKSGGVISAYPKSICYVDGI